MSPKESINTAEFSQMSFFQKLQATGPAWMAAGLNIGGATVTNAVLLASATGYMYGWVFFLATFAIYIATVMCVKLTLITGKTPVALIRTELHPFFGIVFGIAVLIVNIVFHAIQIGLVGGALNTILPIGVKTLSVAAIVFVIILVALPSKNAGRMIQKMLQYMVYVLALSYVISLFVVRPDWSEFFKGVFSFSIPSSKSEVLLFTALLGSALAINVPTVQAYATKSNGWGKERLQLFRFETLLTNLFLLFVQLAVLIVVASTLFRQGITPANGIQAAIALEPIAGRFSTILFSLGMVGALISTMTAQTSVTAYTLSDLLGWDPMPHEKKFKIIQIAMLLFALTVPLFGWNPFVIVSWGASFNATFMPIGILAWAILMNKKDLMGEHAAKPALNAAIAFTFIASLAFAIRFWYITLF